MATSILLKFLTLKWNISRTIWCIEVGDGSLCFSFFTLFHLSVTFFDPCFPLSTKTSQLSTNWEQHMSNPFQIHIGSHIVLTEHCFIALCSVNCWVSAAIYFRTAVFDKSLSPPNHITKGILLSGTQYFYELLRS